jgi:hypothetical protein
MVRFREKEGKLIVSVCCVCLSLACAVQRFWLIYEPVLSATIVASVDQVLQVSTPAFLDSVRPRNLSRSNEI